MLHRNTKILVTVSVIIFVVSTVVCTLFFIMVSKQKAVYAEHVLSRAQIKLHQESLKSLVRTLEDTKSERESLMSRVLQDDEVINFLGLIETLGKEQGIALTTHSLTVLPVNPVFETLVVDISLEGSYEEVVGIIKLLEQLPYQSALNDVKMNRATEENESLWKASLEVKVTKFTKV